MPEVTPPDRFFKVVKNGDARPISLSWSKDFEAIQKGIADTLNARNVAFLLGAGCSSFRVNGEKVGIGTMQPLSQQFCDTTHQFLAAEKQATEEAPWNTSDTQPET